MRNNTKKWVDYKNKNTQDQNTRTCEDRKRGEPVIHQEYSTFSNIIYDYVLAILYVREDVIVLLCNL